MLGIWQKIFFNNYLKAFISFSTKKINLYIISFAFVSFISSLLDISVIFYISNIVISFTKGIPIKKSIFFFSLSFDYTNFNTYISFLIICLTAYLIKILITFYNSYLGAMFGCSLANKFLKIFSNVSYEYYISKKKADFINTYSEDINNSVGSINASLGFLSFFITFLIYITYILATTPKQLSLLLVIFAFLIYIVINNTIGKRIVKISKKINLNNPIRIQKVVDFYSLFKLIKVFNISDVLLKNVLKIDSENRYLNAKAPFLISFPSITIIHLFYLSSVSFIFLQTQFKLLDIQLNFLISLGLILQRSIPLLNQISSSLNTIKLKSLFLVKIYNQYKIMLANSRNVKILSYHNKSKNNSYKLKNNTFITFKEVNYKHQKSKINLYKNNLSFDILTNSSYLVTGNSGSGKSTLIDLILGLRKPTNGNLYLNKKYKSLSDILSYVPQETFCIDDTFLRNLTLFNEKVSSRKERNNINDIFECCLLNELISNFSDGIFQKIGYGGIKLSGGQLQRLSIARALYRKSPLLLMDEPTSSLDGKMSIKIMKNILKFASYNSMTIFVVSHDSNIFPLFSDRIDL